MRNWKHAFTAAILFVAALTTGCGDKGGKLASIRITPSEAMIAKGTSQQFTATAVFSNGMTLTWSSAASWSASDPSAVTVSNEFGSYGLASALKDAPTGTITAVTITATDIPNNISGSAVLTVLDPKEITIEPSDQTLAKNTGMQFKAVASLEDLVSNPSRSTHQDITSIVTWTTTNTAVATVIPNTGYLTTHATGTTEITAEYESSSTTVPIKGSALLEVTD